MKKVTDKRGTSKQGKISKKKKKKEIYSIKRQR
jgi:hypothetical protein